MEVAGKRTDTGDGGSDSKLGNVCEPCQGDTITTQASGYCKDCGEYMCDTCFRHHLRGKLCRHHVLIDVDMANLPVHEGKESERKCNKHHGETTKFYCRKHEVVGCGDCMVLEHNVCKLEYVKDASTNFHENEAFKALVTKIDILTSKSNEIKDNRHEQEQNNKTMLKKALEDIRKFRADINRYLNAVEADVISEAKRIMSDNNELLTKLAQDCKELSFKIENLKQRLNTELYEDNVLFINTVEWKPRVTELEEEIALAHSITMKRFEFVCDQQLRDFVTSSKQLGSLTISQTVPRCQTSQATEGRDENTHKHANKSEDSYDRKEKGFNDSTCSSIPRVDAQSSTGSVPAESEPSGTGQSAVHHQPYCSCYSPPSLNPGADFQYPFKSPTAEQLALNNTGGSNRSMSAKDKGSSKSAHTQIQNTNTVTSEGPPMKTMQTTAKQLALNNTGGSNRSMSAKDKGSSKSAHTQIQNTNTVTSEGPPMKTMQPTAEQLALNHLIHSKDASEDAELQSKIKQIMDLTGFSQDKVEIALYDSKNDIDKAVNELLEGGTDEIERWAPRKKKEKKKKQKQTEAPPINFRRFRGSGSRPGMDEESYRANRSGFENKSSSFENGPQINTWTN